MNICCNSDYCGGMGDFGSRIREIAGAGFTHYFWCHQWNTDFLYTAPELEEIKKVQKSAGLRLLDIHGSSGNEKRWFFPTEYIRKAGVELVKNRLEMLDALEGEGVLVMHAPNLKYFVEGHVTPEEHEAKNKAAREEFEAVCRSLDELMPLLEKYDRKIAIENLQRDDWSFIDAYLTRYPAERLGICYDCGHANILRDRMFEMDKRKSRLAATHLHDNDGTGDQHKPVFTGTVDFGKLAGIIASSAYKGPLSFEISIRNTPFWDPEKDVYNQTPEARKAFLASSYQGCLKLAEMVEAARR